MPQPRKRQLPPIDLGNETIHERITRVRRKRGMSQVELAEAVGLSQSHLSKIEGGSCLPSIELAARIAIALGVTTDELIGTKRTKKQDVEFSLAMVRRMQRIQGLPVVRRNQLLRMIDDFVRREES